MKSRNKILLTVICIFVILSFIGVLFFSYIKPLVKQNQVHSDLMLLDNVIRTCIREYYESNQEYPESLSQIEDKVFEKCYTGSPSGGSKYQELLNKFKVSSNKNKLVLSWQVEKKDAVYCYETVFENGQSTTSISKNK
ncbi:MAG: type II secretion system protein [Phycisphaerae bacterium]|nr:type II secretion system protein [Phycisphaerae bacterium]